MLRRTGIEGKTFIMKEILRVSHLCKEGILKDISFAVEEGEMVAVMGPSGSGKSTLLYQVSGMDQADAGEVWLDDQEIVGLSEDDRARLRLHQMGFVFQQMNMLSHLNILDNILLPSVHADRSRAFRAEQTVKAIRMMRQFGIDGLAERRITDVSGGQLQRACICRSIMLSPRILFADEPTGALNQAASEDVLQAFLRINLEGTTILLVTHDSRVAASCKRILYLLDGELKGELRLGRYAAGERSERERRTLAWLDEMGW